MSKVPKNTYPMNGVVEYNYNYTPKTTFIVNYFTSVDTMIKTINNIRKIGDEIEIIVRNDHGAKDCEKIMSVLTHRNDRMIVSNDLGERRGYHYCAQISIASQYLIFCQDDDLAPDNNQWYLDCLKEFESDPNLGMIGLLKGGWNYSQKNNVTITDKQKHAKIYVSWLATGPLMIRKDVYNKIDGWDNGTIHFSQVGEADGGADADLATQVMIAGYKTMLLRTPGVKEWKRRFERGDGRTNKNAKIIQKTTVWGQNCDKRIITNNTVYFNKYKNKWNHIFELVKKYNKDIGINI